MRRRRKESFLLVGFAFVLVVIIAGIVLLSLQQNSTPPNTPIVLPTITLTPTVPAQTHPPVAYDPSAQDELLDKMLNRQPLSSTDSTARANMLSLLPQGQTSGTLYTSSNVRIEYVQGPDLFQAEILTTDIARAKADANTWLRNQGLSQQGICDLPLMFYLNKDVANQLKNANITFDPLPNNC